MIIGHNKKQLAACIFNQNALQDQAKTMEKICQNNLLAYACPSTDVNLLFEMISNHNAFQ